jgi:amino acid transporter
LTEVAPKKKAIGFLSIVSIGIGGMVGGGIFAVLGLAVQMARGGTPIAFGLAGLVALLTAYSYSRLSVVFPSQGGTVEFLNQGFGNGLFSGGMNILLWLSYTIMLSLYAYAFGSYAASLFSGSSDPLIKHIFISGIVGLLTLTNTLSARFVGELEEWIVGFKVAILLFFVGVGIWRIAPARLQPSSWSPTGYLIAGGMIIFLAYEGFELIANTAGDVRNPKKNLPRGFLTSVVFVIGLYVLVSLVTVGNLPVDKIVAAKDYALAESARPFLGQAGFALIAVAALLSTASAINATLYGASRISYIIAKEGELPQEIERKIWQRPLEGLLITAGSTLVIANLFNLSSISMMGSAGFLLIFASVNAANAKLAAKTESRRAISVAGTIVCLAAFGTLVWQRATTHPRALWALLAMAGFSFSAEAVYRKLTGRVIKPQYARDGEPSQT